MTKAELLDQCRARIQELAKRVAELEQWQEVKTLRKLKEEVFDNTPWNRIILKFDRGEKIFASDKNYPLGIITHYYILPE